MPSEHGLPVLDQQLTSPCNLSSSIIQASDIDNFPASIEVHESAMKNTLMTFIFPNQNIDFIEFMTLKKFIMCFDLTSTQRAAHDFLHPELTNCSVSLDLQFSNALTANLEIFVWGIRSSNVFITSDGKVTKNVLPISTV